MSEPDEHHTSRPESPECGVEVVLDEGCTENPGTASCECTGDATNEVAAPERPAQEPAQALAARSPLAELPITTSQQNVAAQVPRTSVSPSTSTSASAANKEVSPASTRRTPIRILGVQRHNEVTTAYLEARSRREFEIHNRRLDLEERRLLQAAKEHEDNVRLREAELRERQLEREALAEERRLMASERQAYFEMIKRLHNKGEEP